MLKLMPHMPQDLCALSHENNLLQSLIPFQTLLAIHLFICMICILIKQTSKTVIGSNLNKSC